MSDIIGIESAAGSFRDPSNRVFLSIRNGRPARVLRGIDQASLSHFNRLVGEGFYRPLTRAGSLVRSRELSCEDDAVVGHILKQGWAGVLEHEVVPFVSYPYEWSFSMLQDAALLHLQILEEALEGGWMLKDASPYNIQFKGVNPVFIDIPSFEPWVQGEAWLGYRQFCTNFLIPLMMRAYLGIDARALLRSCLEGIGVVEAAQYFRGFARFRRGVPSHIYFPAAVEKRIAARERNAVPAKDRSAVKHSKAMVVGLVQSLSRLVKSLKIKQEASNWSDYSETHSYEGEELAQKKAFVEQVASRRYSEVWDLGCNTGTFSRLLAGRADCVISVDADHNVIEKLYRDEQEREGTRILPLVLDLANLSPDQGFGGRERTAFDKRGKPELVLALALVHHMRLSANVPLDIYFDWLRGLGAEVVIEFVDRHDEMVVKLLTNKKESYADYNRDAFVREAGRCFSIKARLALKGDKRELFHLVPK